MKIPSLSPRFRAGISSQIVGNALPRPEMMVHEGNFLASSVMVRDHLRLWLANRPHEIFAAVFLDEQRQILGAVEVLSGNLALGMVNTRQIALDALSCNANSVIVAHHCPSGSPDPPALAIALTQHIKSVLAPLDVRLLDCLVLTRCESVSLAWRGLI